MSESARLDAAVELQSVSINGHRWTFRTAGQGPVLLLVHGMAGSSATWTRVIGPLAERFTVLAPDLIGHGESAKPPGDYSLAAHAAGLRDLLLVLGHERATVAGQSFGGGVALQFAYHFPERCERLILVGSGGLGREVMFLLRALSLPGSEHVLAIFCSPALQDAGTAISRFLRRMGLSASPAAEEIWRGYASLATAEARAAFLRTLRCVIDFDGQAVSATDRLHLAEKLPTLIIWGDRDPILPAVHGKDAHRAIAGSRLEIFEGVGHFPHCEAPERFVRLLSDFMSSTAPARLTAGADAFASVV